MIKSYDNKNNSIEDILDQIIQKCLQRKCNLQRASQSSLLPAACKQNHWPWRFHFLWVRIFTKYPPQSFRKYGKHSSTSLAFDRPFIVVNCHYFIQFTWRFAWFLLLPSSHRIPTAPSLLCSTFSSITQHPCCLATPAISEHRPLNSGHILL